MRKHKTSFTENKLLLLVLSATILLDYFSDMKKNNIRSLELWEQPLVLLSLALLQVSLIECLTNMDRTEDPRDEAAACPAFDGVFSARALPCPRPALNSNQRGGERPGPDHRKRKPEERQLARRSNK